MDDAPLKPAQVNREISRKLRPKGFVNINRARGLAIKNRNTAKISPLPATAITDDGTHSMPKTIKSAT
jgi:hypothetical protein